jgi:hypothetical protein
MRPWETIRIEGETMKAFVILSNNKTKELSVMSKKDYHANVQNIYNYEPLSSTDTMEDANLLKDHIQSIGVQTYFDNIISNRTCID